MNNYTLSPFDVIRSSVQLDDLAQRLGYDVRRGQILCPSHADKNPSCKVYSDHYHCFACGWHGDAIDFVCAANKCEPREAVTIISDMFGLGLSFDMPQDRRKEIAESQAKAERERAERDALELSLKGKYSELCAELHQINDRLRKIPKPDNPRFEILMSKESFQSAVAHSVKRRAEIEHEINQINEELYHMRR